MIDAQVEYDNRARVPEHPGIIAGWQRDAAAFRAAWPHRDLGIAYGARARETLDLFHTGSDAPVALFIHGGYWQALDGSVFSHLARGFLEHGVALAVPSTDLCPDVTLATMVAQIRAAAVLVHRRTGRRLLATGHSAGGHLAAMLMATDWRAIDPGLPPDLVAAGLPISGLFELAPLLPTTIGAGLRLTEAEAHALSPRYLPPPGLPLHAVVGGAESGEFLRQTRDFAAAWHGTTEVIPGANHFTILAQLADPAAALACRAAAMARAIA
jgi:arylformamidase